MDKDHQSDQGVTLNQWEIDLGHWCPAQLYYYFADDEGGRWCIYLRWRHEDPWTAELVRCNENWEFIWGSPDNVNLLIEREHTPGIITGYYTEEEYPFLMDKVLEQLKVRFPCLDKKPIIC